MPRNEENLVGYWGDDLINSCDVSVLWQGLEYPGEINTRIAVGDLDEHLIEDVAAELLGFIGKRSRSVFMISFQSVNEAIKQFGQSGTGGLLVVDGEAPTPRIHDGKLHGYAFGDVDEPVGPKGENFS